MNTLPRSSVSAVLILAFTLPVAADDSQATLRERFQQILDDPDLSDLERFHVLRELINTQESAFVAENAKRWVSELGSTDFDARREADWSLTEV